MTDSIGATVQMARAHALGDLLRRSAESLPNKTALICGEVVWTFMEFDEICNRLGRGLAGIEIRSKRMLMAKHSS